MAKVSRLSLGHNPNKAVGSLRRSIEHMAGMTERSKLNTIGQLQSLMCTLVEISNSLGDSPNSRLGSNTGYRISHSGETFLKSMVDKQMNKSMKDFNDRLVSLNSKVPLQRELLQICLHDIIQSIIDEANDELSKLDEEAAKHFRVSQRERLKKTFQKRAEDVLDSNQAACNKEANILVTSFLDKMRPNRIDQFEDIDPEMFLRMKDFFTEFMKYFEDQSKDPDCCKLQVYQIDSL